MNRTRCIRRIIGLTIFALCVMLTSPLQSDTRRDLNSKHSQTPIKERKRIAVKKSYSTKPLKAAKPVRWSHAPYIQGNCSICHQRDNPKNPGSLKGPINDQCLRCHEATRHKLESSRGVHKPVKSDCTTCHNPHNSNYRMLLHRPPKTLCTSCHIDLAKMLKTLEVRHAPVVKGRTCRNCHDAHTSRVQHLLKGLPYDICMKCHGKDGLKDEQGRQLTNFSRLLKENPIHHEPVEKKDCAACHLAHGGQFFRMLTSEYPEEFYAVYKRENYELCFGCHDERSFSRSGSAVLTGFRDGNRNLHALHVSRQLGRSCRACHEIHATKQSHLVRDKVPYGTGGWMLEINYIKTEKGGRCSKTCHTTKEYTNR